MAIRTNYCANPSFEANPTGLCTGLTVFKSITGVPVYSKVAAICGSGSFAQRIQYAGVAGDAGGKMLSLYFAAYPLVAADVVAISGVVLGSISGATMVLEMLNQAWGSATGPAVAVSPTSTANRYSAIGPMSAGTTSSFFRISFSAIHEGDAIDITIDDALIEKSAALGAYFDGSYSFCHWTEVANASASISSGLTVAPVLPRLQTRILAQGVMQCD